jgi:hypothetical protein
MTITVKELIEQLAELPPDLEVLVAKDGEGNAFRTFTGCSVGFAEKEGEPRRDGRCDYEFYHEEYYSVDPETGESDYPGDNAVVLWP